MPFVIPVRTINDILNDVAKAVPFGGSEGILLRSSFVVEVEEFNPSTKLDSIV